MNLSEGQHIQRICPLWGSKAITGDIFKNCALQAYQAPAHSHAWFTCCVCKHRNFFCCTFTYIKNLLVNIYRHYFSCLEKQIVPFILLILYPLDFKDCMMMLVKGFTNFKAGTKMHLSLQKNLDPSQETRFWEKKESIDLQCTNCITYSKIYSKSKPEFCFGNAESKWQRCKGLQLSWHGG